MKILSLENHAFHTALFCLLKFQKSYHVFRSTLIYYLKTSHKLNALHANCLSVITFMKITATHGFSKIVNQIYPVRYDTSHTDHSIEPIRGKTT